MFVCAYVFVDLSRLETGNVGVKLRGYISVSRRGFMITSMEFAIM